MLTGGLLVGLYLLHQYAADAADVYRRDKANPAADQQQADRVHCPGRSC